MRTALALVVALLGAPALRAAPLGRPPVDPSSPRGEARRAGSREVARQLVTVVDQVAEQYVRPVPRAELVRAALAGLYEGARRPVPRDLEARVKRAAGGTGGADKGPGGPAPLPPPRDDALVEL